MENIAAVIAKTPLFSGLSREQITEIGSIALEKTFPKGKLIFSEGDEGEGFYVIVDGRVKIYKLSAEGKEQTLHIYSSGQAFGEVPVFAGEHFPANAETIRDTRTLFFPRAAFLSLIAKNPALSLKLLADLSFKLRQFTVQIENLSLKEIPARLATYLLYLAEEQGRQDSVLLGISKGQLASLLGTIPETLSRMFARLTAQELIRVDGRKILLLDLEGLKDLAESGKSYA
jgi:CRP/FNR family transcriptional regulator